ncbi:MAG: CDP-alcohol phosphatidyltransferase family protein [Sphingomonas bacterium]|nr:CDP-alcohol phosphatidyltransferase family protein [Sphingomonas bacterium]
MKPVQRIQENLLAGAERRVLNWLCARLPAWVKPDHLTGLGLLGALMVLIGFVASSAEIGWLWLSIAGFCVHWFGDSLDGSLARFRQIERPRFGYFIDHSCDGLANLMIMAGLGLTAFVRLDVALFALTGYLLMSIHAFLAARVLGELSLSFSAFGPTELRLMLIAITLSMFVLEPDPMWSALDWLIAASGAILLTIFIAQTILTARRIAAEGE